MNSLAFIEPKILEPFMFFQNDYVMAVVINQMGNALVFEGGQSHAGVRSWHVIGRGLEEGENPIKAVQHELSQCLGHDQGYWIYLGSYEGCQGRVGHLFCAKDVPHTEPLPTSCVQAKWVPLHDLRLALLDGRFSDMSIAANVALTLFLLPTVS